MSESPCKCYVCIKKYMKKEKETLADIMIINRSMCLVGNFNRCIACKFLFENTDDSKLHLCNRCNHLYEGELGVDEDECECWREEFIPYFHHVIKTYTMGVCAYCKSEDTEYEKGVDNSIKFILDDYDAFFTMICKKCGRKTNEYYNIEFKVSEGI